MISGSEAVQTALTAHARATLSGGSRKPSWGSTVSVPAGQGDADTVIDPATALVKEAVKRGTADNVTAIVVILPWD